jgi:hypothetical protein
MQRRSSLLAICLLIALPLVVPKTPHLAPPEGPPPASTSDILIVEQPEPPSDNELDYVLPEDLTVQP